MTLFNAFTAVGALKTLIDFILSNTRRFYSSMGNSLAVKGLNFMITLSILYVFLRTGDLSRPCALLSRLRSGIKKHIREYLQLREKTDFCWVGSCLKIVLSKWLLNCYLHYHHHVGWTDYKSIKFVVSIQTVSIFLADYQTLFYFPLN